MNCHSAVIGTATGIGYYGSFDDIVRGKAEQVWRLEVKKVALEDGYILRDGGFIELGEQAEWVLYETEIPDECWA